MTPDNPVIELDAALRTTEVASDADAVAALVAVVLPTIRQQRELTHSLVESLLAFEGLSPRAIAMARRNAEFRIGLAEQFGFFTEAEIESGSHRTGGRDQEALADHWLKDRRIFAVMIGETPLFLRFQFDESGEPLLVLHDILVALNDTLQGWEVASWLTRGHSSLGDRQPLELWRTDPEAVVAAASTYARSRSDPSAAP